MYEEIKAIVCGGRDYDDYETVFKILSSYNLVRIAQGGAKGADLLAKRYAEENGIELVQYEADWDRHGKTAGPVRNLKMLEKEKPDIVIAFPGGKGTAHMVSISLKARVDRVVQVGSEKDLFDE